MTPQDANPYRPTSADAEHHTISPTRWRTTTLLILLSWLSPGVGCYLVVDDLVGIEQLKVHYWIEHGIVISVVLNFLAVLPFLSQTVRRNSVAYAFVAFLGCFHRGGCLL